MIAGMKYIYYIIFVALFLTALMAFPFHPLKQEPKAAALVINKHVITRDELEDLYMAKSPQVQDRAALVNALITKELMIQEAQREGIDKDPAFRKSIENFYEQSLIKLLLDRKFAGLHAEVSEGDVEHYLDLYKKLLHLTIWSADDIQSAANGRFTGMETRTLRCQDLSEEVRERVAALKEGESTKPIRTGAGCMVIRLDRTEPLSGVVTVPDRQAVQLLLKEQKKRQEMDQWLADLRRNAAISDFSGKAGR